MPLLWFDIGYFESTFKAESLKLKAFYFPTACFVKHSAHVVITVTVRWMSISLESNGYRQQE